MHPDVETKIIAGHYRVLREILRDTAADHEEAGFLVLDLELRELVEILAAVPRHVGGVALGRLDGDQFIH